MILQRLATLSLFVWLLSSQVPAESCEEHLYLGFDTRLQPVLSTRLPLVEGQAIAGFELIDRFPVVAQTDAVVAFDGKQHLVLPAPSGIRTLSIDSAKRMFLQTAGGTYRASESGFAAFDASFQGIIANSGTPTVLEAVTSANETALTLIRPDGVRLGIVSRPGVLRTFSWNLVGLAAVIDDRLIVWPEGGSQIVELARDPGLLVARDVVLVGPDRAVVAFENFLALLSREGRLVIAGLRARVRWNGDTLHILDERSGVVWNVHGLSDVGRRESDSAYARALVDALPDDASESHTAFLEAARIVGCQGARQMR